MLDSALALDRTPFQLSAQQVIVAEFQNEVPFLWQRQDTEALPGLLIRPL